MKKFVVSTAFILAGSAFWWGLSNVARFSVKKWDATFDTVLRHSLSTLNVSNEDVISSVNELKTDTSGDYVIRRMTFQRMSKGKVDQLREALEKAGANVHLTGEGSRQKLIVQRGSRTYQEITLLP